MVKNKKTGFSLIELIATIALLAIMATIILVNMVGVKTSEENKSAERFQKNVEEAACAYIDLMGNTTARNNCKGNANHSDCKVKLATLIGQSVALIDSDAVDPYTNKTAEEEKNCITVQIRWTNGEKKCTMQRGSGCQ